MHETAQTASGGFQDWYLGGHPKLPVPCLHPRRWFPRPFPARSLASHPTAGPVAGGLNPLQPEIWKSQGLQDSFWSSPSPFTARCFPQRAHRRDPARLPEAGLLAAAADVRGRAGQPAFCGSQEPLQPGNSGRMLSPGMVLSLTDLSSPGRHDRCWEHMLGINSLRHSHEREPLPPSAPISFAFWFQPH